MNNRLPVGPRGNQILKLLFDHGPLSNATLRAVIEPTMNQRKMRGAIQRLKKLGLIRNRHSSIARTRENFFELSQEAPSREVFKVVFNATDEDLAHIPGGTEALEHWQECVLWAKHLRGIYKDAKIVHDFQMMRSPEVRALFRMSESAKMHAYPDLLIMTKRDDGTTCTVAVEVERTQKSAFRIIRKLRTLAITSEINGVLYIASHPHVAKTVQRIYTKHVLPRARRVERYGDQFLLMSDGKINPENGMIGATDLKGSGTNLVGWMMSLPTRKDDGRLRKK